MGLFGKKKTIKEDKPFDKTNDVEKLVMFITIVNNHQGKSIVKMLSRLGVAAQFVQKGEGTASRQIRDILGIEDNSKDIVISLVKKNSIPEIKMELEAFFAASKKNKGIGFSIPMTSIAGVKIYQFLSDAL